MAPETTDYRRLPPVPEAERPDPPARLSMTYLQRDDCCPRSLMLDLRHHGGASSHEMMRGTLLHIFCERMLWTLIEGDEPNLYAAAEGEDPFHAKRQVASHTAAIVDEILRERPDLVVPAAEVDRVREMAYHVAVGYDVKPEEILRVEAKFVLDVAGWEVVGKVDVLHAQGDELVVDDWKSSLNPSDQEEHEHSFQHKLYCAAVAFGQVTMKVECPECHGTAQNGCEGGCRDGRVEVRGGNLASGVDVFRGRAIFPRYLNDDGTLRTRSASWTRTRLRDFLADIERQVVRVSERFASGDWPAVPGSHCNQCPAKLECPIPPVLRDLLGTVESREDAEAAMAYVTTESLRIEALKRASKEFAPFVVGDLIWEVKASESTVTDLVGLAASLARQQVTGEPVDLAAHQKPRQSASFRKRKLTPDEKASAA